MLTGEVVMQYDGSGFKWAKDQPERNKLWTARHNAFYAVLAAKPNCRASVKSAVCVSIMFSAVMNIPFILCSALLEA